MCSSDLSVFLLLFTIAFNFGFGLLQARHRSRWLLFAAVAGNLSVLGWFKYAAFIAQTVTSALAAFGWTVGNPRMSTLLPLGISFFTFHHIMYLTDLRAGRAPGFGLVKYALYIAFFPQVLAGPLVRWSEIMHQFDERP